MLDIKSIQELKENPLVMKFVASIRAECHKLNTLDDLEDGPLSKLLTPEAVALEVRARQRASAILRSIFEEFYETGDGKKQFRGDEYVA